MRSDETKVLEKNCFQVEPCQRNEEERNNVAVGKVIMQILDLFMAEGHLAEYYIYDHVLMNHITQHV